MGNHTAPFSSVVREIALQASAGDGDASSARLEERTAQAAGDEIACERATLLADLRSPQ